MHDIRAIRADSAAFDAAMARRGLADQAKAVVQIDFDLRRAQTEAQTIQARRNNLAKLFGAAKKAGEDTAALEEEATYLRGQVDGNNAQVATLSERLNELLASLPNRLDDSVPYGGDESDNVEMSRHGEPVRLNTAHQHFELGEALGLMDFAAAAKMSGSRFTILRGPLARLERALGQFMLENALAHGYVETSVPLLANDAAVFGTSQLPKFADDLFRTTDGRWLIPTAEVPLTNLVAGEILAADTLPMRVTALTDCFRSEAGSAGRDTRGMLRQHQFKKVELVSIVRPEDSDAEHERMTDCAGKVLTDLGLTWRKMLLCAGDTGFGSARTYDLEVWLPGQGAWREISSCSTMRDFQARRMNARVRSAADPKRIEFVHTLNGSGVAVGRALIAVMETYQQPDGSITVPEALRPWMKTDLITKDTA